MVDTPLVAVVFYGGRPGVRNSVRLHARVRPVMADDGRWRLRGIAGRTAPVQGQGRTDEDDTTGEEVRMQHAPVLCMHGCVRAVVLGPRGSPKYTWYRSWTYIYFACLVSMLVVT